MKTELTFSWECDFVVIARDSDDKEVCRIDFAEMTRQHPTEKIIRGDKETDNHKIFMYDNGGSASIATQDEIAESVANYFTSHDINSFDIMDLWCEIMCDHLCAWIDLEWWNED